MTTIDIINKLNLSDEKKLKLLALYVDGCHWLPPARWPLQDFIDDVFNEDQQGAGTCCPTGPPGERGEPGIPDDDDIKTRYDELLAPLEDLGSLGAVPDASPFSETCRRISVPGEELDRWIAIMQNPDDTELPPPGTTIRGLSRHFGTSQHLHLELGIALVSAEGGPFIDAYLQKDEDIVCEHKPIRDTEFLESRSRISMQYGEQMFEFEIVPTK